MAKRTSPTASRRRLSIDLRHLREESGLTAAEAAKRAGFPAASRISNMEKQKWRIPRVDHVTALLDVYGVMDAARRLQLLNLVDAARQRGWWDGYHLLSATESTYIGLEAAAGSLRTYQAITLPGLLQTPEYTRATILGGVPAIPRQELDERLYIHAQRCRLLTEDPDLLHMWAVVDEAALHRQVGGQAVMRDQLEHLLELGDRDNIHIQVLPFAAGAHPGAAPFIVIDFPEDADPEVVYVRSPVGSRLVEDPKEVVRHRLLFERLIPRSLPVRATLTVIEKLLTKLPG